MTVEVGPSGPLADLPSQEVTSSGRLFKKGHHGEELKSSRLQEENRDEKDHRRGHDFDVLEDGAEEEEDGAEDDDDSTASDSSSNYSSVSEDLLTPIHAHNHVYHGSGRMVIPNDPCENQRQAYQHELFTICLGGDLTLSKLPLKRLSDQSKNDDSDIDDDNDNHHSPPPFHILDIGCGGGHWAMDMALSYPHADVLGIELSSTNLPKQVPPNLTFEIADAAEEWPPRLYDFIHMRNLVGGGIRDFKKLLIDAFAHLKPGGQLEFTDVTPLFVGLDPDPLADSSSAFSSGGGGDASGSDDAGPRIEKPRAAIGAATLEYGEVFAEISAAQGLDFDPTSKISSWLMEIGADSVCDRADWLPVRSWARDPLTRKKGEILNKMLGPGCEHWTLRMFTLAGWEEAKIRDLLSRVLEEMENPLLKSCIKVTFISAKKPPNNKMAQEAEQHSKGHV